MNMRKSNQEITDKKLLIAILESATICRVAMVDEGKPYLLPFNYGYSNGAIYIHCASEGRKLDIIRTNPEAWFEVEDTAELIPADQPCKWTTFYRSVMGSGTIQIIDDPAVKRYGLEVIMRQHGAEGEMVFEDREVKNMLILKLEIGHLSGKQSGNWQRIVDRNRVEMESARLRMEEVSEADLEQIHQLHSIPEVDEFNTLGIPRNIQHTTRVTLPVLKARHSHPRSRYEWKIILKETDKFIGLAGMTLSNDKFRLGEIYYKLHPDQWGKGFATEVARQLIITGFEKFGLHKVEAGVATGNERSIRVLEKCGMTREGLQRKILPIRGEWIDNYHYAIVETDPRPDNH